MDRKAISHFKKNDLLLYNTILKIGEIKPYEIRNSGDYFSDLCESIVGQQLSGKAASTIWGRFISLMPQKKVTPQNVLKVDTEDMRKAGMSYSKAKYVKDLAEKVKDKLVKLDQLERLSDQEVVDELVKVKGIGPWTAEMFLMSSLAREDVFSAGDLGLKRAIEKLYEKENPSREEMETISIKWSPYRTYACTVLWNSLNNI